MIQLNSAAVLLDNAAAKYGGKTAFSDEWSEISFRELRQTGRAVGTALINATDGGYLPAPVMVYLKKSISCVVCFMGAMYSANPYVPLAIDTPLNRLQKTIDNMNGRAHIITDEAGLEKIKSLTLPDGIKVHIYDDLTKTEPDDALVDKTIASVTDLDPIYIMYTSGSTGTPKGVTVSHRGVIDYAMWLADTFHIDENSVIGNQSAFHFDNCTFDIFSTLLTGAKTVIIPESLFMFPHKLPEFLRDNEVTIIFWVPTIMINVANSGALEEIELPKLKYVTFAGEVMPNKQLNIWRKAQPHCVYANLYGPTEISVDCTYYIVDRDFADSDPLPIGVSCRNMRVIILNDKDEIAETNEQGEICVIGSGLALGYWNADDITEKVFVRNPANPYYNEQIYRTGDLGYVNGDGLIMYLGRKDTQVKVRGNRIELSEVEIAAMCVDGVTGACALLDSEKQHIVLFAESIKPLKLRTFNLEMKKYVPNYMLPGELIVMDKFPHTANDKIDRVTLKKSLENRQRREI